MFDFSHLICCSYIPSETCEMKSDMKTHFLPYKDRVKTVTMHPVCPHFLVEDLGVNYSQ